MSATFGGGGGIAGFQYKHLQANESIQAFLRSFLHEKHRWNELIEAMLLYGIHCMAQNYSLQTLNVDQVQHITRRRDMDEWTHVLGKPWVDAAWRAYVAATGYPCPSITTSSDSILHSYADLIAATSSIVVTNNHIHIPSSSHLSFLDYLRGFVVHCINSPARPSPTPPSIAAASKPSPQPRAKALEIAHVFATSQFMHDLPPSTENDDPTINDTPAQRMLRTELYGHHDLNPSTLQATGCVAPPDFKGWLGDYGPAHTKTVAPPDWTDLEDEGSAWLQDAARRRGYSWDLERIQLEGQSKEGRPFDEGRNLDGHGEASGGEAEEDDPAFEWLVHDSSNADGIASQHLHDEG
ncbi:hypothetical protein B5M09_006078 [Aphanomyces astaci]|uniref:Uncharacterized protein n=1 Tax=Aphanomyces astaci TaxID=112090 RepID=A0A3R7WL98_APHAT|nr:hypothetical protein B5M09_006078 [Aphanomyces astaci]